MKTLLISSVALAMLAGSVGAAEAQPRNSHNQGNHYAQQQQQQHRHWRKGERVDRNEWNRSRRIDYRTRHLRAPPRGYEWRQTSNGDIILAAVATGLILQLFSN